MDNISIQNKLSSLAIPNDGYNFFEINGYYWGRGSNKEFCFGFETRKITITPITQTTKLLSLSINESFLVLIEGNETRKRLSLLILKSDDPKLVGLFIKLSNLLSIQDGDNELLKHFLQLKELFSNEKRPDINELQGLYGELFSMYYLKVCYGIDISVYYQRVSRDRFDFSVNPSKRIEIKSTLKPNRIHHFRHQQLDIDRFDIVIISVMLQRDECGLSLQELINQCNYLFSDNLPLLFHIEMITRNMNTQYLDALRFNYEYSMDLLGLYNARDLPRITEKNVDGVFNVEYDVDFTKSKTLQIPLFKEWLVKKAE